MVCDAAAATTASDARGFATTVHAASARIATLARSTTGQERRALAAVADGMARQASAFDHVAADSGLTIPLAAACDEGWTSGEDLVHVGVGQIGPAFDEPSVVPIAKDEAADRLRDLTVCASFVDGGLLALVQPIPPPLTAEQAQRALEASATSLPAGPPRRPRRATPRSRPARSCGLPPRTRCGLCSWRATSRRSGSTMPRSCASTRPR